MIELMIAVTTIDILAATAIPQYQNCAVRSEGTSVLATINPLKTTIKKSLSCGTAGSKIKIDTTVSTATETYVGIVPDVNRLGVIAVAIEDSGAGDISFTLQTGTSSPKNTTKAITLSRTADSVWTCKPTQDETFIPKGCIR